MRVVQQFNDPTLAVQTTLSVLATTAMHASPALIQKTGSGITVQSQSLERPLVVFDIDDTLIRANNEPVIEVLRLFRRLKELNCRIFLVTARSASIRNQTLRELESVGITQRDFERLLLCPELYRKSMKTVGDWKRAARQSIANEFKMPILLTVGDQWTDLVSVQSSAELQQLDDALGVAHAPWVLMRLEDGIGFFGLKLKD